MTSFQEESALDLKNNGNSHFLKCHFTEALACYSKGIAICDKSTTTTTKRHDARDGGKNEDRKRDKASSNVRACPHDEIATSYE